MYQPKGLLPAPLPHLAREGTTSRAAAADTTSISTTAGCEQLQPPINKPEQAATDRPTPPPRRLAPEQTAALPASGRRHTHYHAHCLARGQRIRAASHPLSFPPSSSSSSPPPSALTSSLAAAAPSIVPAIPLNCGQQKNSRHIHIDTGNGFRSDTRHGNPPSDSV